MDGCVKRRGRAGASVGLVLVAGCAGLPRPPAPPSTYPAVVLQELHRLTGREGADTLVVSIAPGRVLVAHAGGDAILDTEGDRFLLLDPATRTYRSLSLRVWEQQIEAALEESTPERSLDATPAVYDSAGPGGVVAGFACDRYYLFTHRELFPGEVEAVEQEIWVTRELELPPGSWEAYERVLRSLDRMGLDVSVRRPPGVTLRTRIRRRPAGSDAEEVEEIEVLRVERRHLEASVFEVPPSYRAAAKDTTGDP